MNTRFSMRRLWCRVLGPMVVGVSVLVLPSCGEDNASGLPPVQRANIRIDVEPNPVIGVQNTVTGTVSAALIVKIREVNGLGVTVTFVNATVFEPESGREVGGNFFDSTDLIVFVGTDRIEPMGELDVDMTVAYGLPEFRVEAFMSVAVQVLDDRGSIINRTILVDIVPESGELPS